MLKYVSLYLAAAAVFFPLDFIWLAIVAKDFYRGQLGPLLLERPNMAVAAGFYAVYLVGLVIFAMSRAAIGDGWREAALYGALFGFFAYATYDLTNLATLKGFTVKVAIVDIAWGTALSAVSAAAGVVIARDLLGLAGR
jgi:uncharacterized membrane protein